MRLMAEFFRAYPWQALLTLLALLFAGVAEGIGLSALLPLLNMAIRNDGSPSATGAESSGSGDLERVVNGVLLDFGIDPGIGVLLVVIVCGVTVKSLLLLVAQKQVGYTAARVATDLRLDMLRAMLRSRWQYFLDQPVGRLSNALATEAQRSSESFVNGATVVTYLVQAVIYCCVAIAVSWKATLASLFVGLLIIGVSHFLVRMAHSAGKRQTGLMISLLSGLTDTLQSVKPLKAMAREDLVDEVLAAETSSLNQALRRQVFSRAVLGVAQEEMFTIMIALGMFVALVQFSMPLTTVMVLVLVLGRMLAQFGKAQRQYQRVMVGESAYWSIKSAIQTARDAEEGSGAGEMPVLETALRFEAVRFSYGEATVLDGLSMDIPAGSLTTLSGPSGAGKTTAIDLMISFMQPDSGSILVDGRPLEKLDTRAWRRMIGYVPQETLLLHDTILHNVTLGDPGLTDADAERALRAAGAWDFVTALPQRMRCLVGERGGKLSGGQRQRIMIARALVHRPGLLILDEATSALDPASEAAICDTLEELRGELTIFAVSHREALLDVADRVYRLEGGKAIVCENGAILPAVGC